MVAIILKWMLASIPAIILLYLVMAVLSFIMFALVGGGAIGLGALLDNPSSSLESAPVIELPALENGEIPDIESSDSEAAH